MVGIVFSLRRDGIGGQGVGRQKSLRGQWESPRTLEWSAGHRNPPEVLEEDRNLLEHFWGWDADIRDRCG